jgi:ubiquinone/menaquinone biosynthesis C-methylase UbiE
VTEAPPAETFAAVDAVHTELRSAMIEYLDRTAALPAIRHIRQLARAAMGIREGARLLDAGCGLGEETRELAGLVGVTGQVTGIDLSDALVAAAERRDNGTGVRYAVGDITSLEFPDDTFHAVRSERVIQHVPDPDAAIAELKRVTVPGGRVCVIDTDWHSTLVDGVPAEYADSLMRLARDKGMGLGPTGRLLRGQFIRAGLAEVTASPVTIPVTDWPTAELLMPVTNRRVFEYVLDAPKDLVDTWFSTLEDAFARDEFLAVLTVWVVTGIKPASVPTTD